MSISASRSLRPLAAGVRFTKDELVVDLVDGRTVSVPLEWFPRLRDAAPAQRAHWEVIGRGGGIHWPDVDEDVSVQGLVEGQPSQEQPFSAHKE